MKQLVIRNVTDKCNQYIAIMDKSIADFENAKDLFKTAILPIEYEIFCSHMYGDKELKTENCVLNRCAHISPNDIFNIPTVDEYIKLGMILLSHNMRFNKKKNKIIKIEKVIV